LDGPDGPGFVLADEAAVVPGVGAQNGGQLALVPVYGQTLPSEKKNVYQNIMN
jgi:hypothetical protein